NFFNGAVHTVAVDSSNNLWVGGAFVGVTSATCYYLCKWTGAAWNNPISPALTGAVYTIAFNGADTYIGGGFVVWNGNANANYILRHNGTSWGPVGAGTNNAVRSLVVYNNEIYAGG